MNKLLSTSAIVVLIVFTCIVFIKAASAENLNLFCFKKQNITVTLKNEADINKSKDVISKIPNVKITDIKYRDKEWSKMVNKYDLPNMENPFKNEFIIRINKNSNKEEIFNKIKGMSFVENIEFTPDKNNKN